MDMIRYVLGFAFDDRGHVALIRKIRPDWQAGKWNGIGGKIELDELPRDAMKREFYEETGVYIPVQDWDIVGKMTNPTSFEVMVLSVRSNLVRDCTTTTDEVVALFQPFNLPTNNMIENVLPIIQLLGIRPQFRPFFTFEYNTEHT